MFAIVRLTLKPSAQMRQALFALFSVIHVSIETFSIVDVTMEIFQDNINIYISFSYFFNFALSHTKNILTTSVIMKTKLGNRR